VVICLERGADLHMAQLLPLPLTVSCFSKIQIGITFLVPAHPGSPGQRAIKCVCVCVCVMILIAFFSAFVNVPLFAGVKTSSMRPEQRGPTYDAVAAQLTETRRTRGVTRQTLSLYRRVQCRFRPRRQHQRPTATHRRRRNVVVLASGRCRGVGSRRRQLRRTGRQQRRLEVAVRTTFSALAVKIIPTRSTYMLVFAILETFCVSWECSLMHPRLHTVLSVRLLGLLPSSASPVARRGAAVRVGRESTCSSRRG